MFTIEYAKNLQWNDITHSSFDCVVKYAEFDRELPATANDKDKYPHIQQLWTRGLAGDFGAIAEKEV